MPADDGLVCLQPALKFKPPDLTITNPTGSLTMRTFKPERRLATLATIALLALGVQARAASSALGNFMEASAAVIPNELAVSASQEVSYDDNVYRAVEGEEQGRWIFTTGLSARWFRTSNYLTYGLEGEITYDHYHKEAHELSEFVYSLSPILMGNIGLGMGDLYLNFFSTSDFERINNTDQRYARSYTNGVQAVWNVIDHERWGLAVTGDWAYEYYPDQEFENNTNQTYGISVAPFYQLTGKTRLGLRLGYDKTKYKNAEQHDDSDSVFLNAFIDYRMTQKFSVYAEAGAEKKSYDGETEGTKGDGDFTPNYRLTLRYAPVTNVALSLSLEHSPEDSYAQDQRGMMKETTSTFTAAWTVNPKFIITQSLKHSLQDEKESVLDTVQYLYELRADYSLRENLTLYGEYSYDIVHYSYDHDLDYAINEFMLGVSWTF